MKLNEALAVRQLAALAQTSRLAMYRALVVAGSAGLTAGQIAETCGLAPNSVSFHAKELLGAGLAQAQAEGRFVRYTASFDAMNALLAYLSENCCAGAACGPGAKTCTTARPAKAHAH